MNNYPLGADYEPDAPWKQEEQPEHEIEVTVSLTISKTMKVKVDDYISFGEDDIDYSMCDLKEAAKPFLPNIKGWDVDDFEVNLE